MEPRDKIYMEFLTKDLQSPNNKIVITEDRFCFQEQNTLILDQLSFTNDDFTIKDLNGVEYFKCLGKTFSIKDKKVIYDLYDQPILNIRQNLLSSKDEINIYKDKTETEALLNVKPQSNFFKQILKQKYIVNFHNKATGKDEFLEIRGDFYGYKFKVYYGKKKEGAPLICNISLKPDTDIVIDSIDSYYVFVAAGVDAAAMIALAICTFM
ncbi:hypothetical protein BCR32DRAFT_326509 [Anaeromyces robustus]|jgi:uncharacterized protein YxjI|uniref:Tubby C-terminal domain-containing protein n=1 Tax=Anaeromyces robustus TaxID=1754192 RepID=A0A1Y1XBM4_9FUNG|nr:hypothetical protein BCR32DRAFT_326509 [Anaeromyces robustus]|eukprot:ORX83125.1 hypothetical protein BCR32DRAFT_326509 [Anaeromyces robustus]